MLEMRLRQTRLNFHIDVKDPLNMAINSFTFDPLQLSRESLLLYFMKSPCNYLNFGGSWEQEMSLS